MNCVSNEIPFEKIHALAYKFLIESFQRQNVINNIVLTKSVMVVVIVVLDFGYFSAAPCIQESHVEYSNLLKTNSLSTMT